MTGLFDVVLRLKPLRWQRIFLGRGVDWAKKVQFGFTKEYSIATYLSVRRGRHLIKTNIRCVRWLALCICVMVTVARVQLSMGRGWKSAVDGFIYITFLKQRLKEGRFNRKLSYDILISSLGFEPARSFRLDRAFLYLSFFFSKKLNL